MQVIVIGSGAAGTEVAFKMCQLGDSADIKLFSADTFPEYSPCVLSQYIAGTLSRKKVFLKSISNYRQQGIKLFMGEQITGIDTDNKVVISNKRDMPYDKLIIATGSRAIVPKIPGTNKIGVFSLKSIVDADGILNYKSRKAVVVGAGAIGVEASVALIKKGVKVYLIEHESQILPKVFNSNPALIIERYLRNRGIEVFTAERVLEIQGTSVVKRVVTNNQTIACDMVVLATGMAPEVELARQADLEIGQFGGIRVNRQMLTTNPNIYACGDCVEVEDFLTGMPRLSLKWYDARLQGAVAASNCIGMHKHYPGSYQLTALNLHDIDAISMGIGESTLQTIKINEVRIREMHHHKYHCWLILGDGRLLGAQLVGNAQYFSSVLNVMMKRYVLRSATDLVISRKVPIISLMRFVGKYVDRAD